MVSNCGITIIQIINLSTGVGSFHKNIPRFFYFSKMKRNCIFKYTIPCKKINLFVNKKDYHYNQNIIDITGDSSCID